MQRKEKIISNRILLMPLRDIDYIPMMEMVKDDKIKETYMLPDFSSIDEEASFFHHLKELSLDLTKFIYGIYYNDLLVGFMNEVDKKNLEIELGYFISPKYWNTGFATEALGIAIDNLFEMGYSMVLASYFEENIASAKVMQKCGMFLLNRKDTIEYRGKIHNCIYYGIRRIDKEKYATLIGDKIILRAAKIKDYSSMLKNVWGDIDVYKWMLYTPTLNEEDAIKRNERSMQFQKNHYAYYIALKESDIAIGLCGIREYEEGRFEETGICIGKEYQGMGIGKEVVSLLLDLSFNKLMAKDFLYGYFNDNMKSMKLAKSFGFTYDHEIELIRPWDNEKKRISICILKKEDYEKSLEE